MECAEVRDNIAARRSGWLSREKASRLDAHLASCAACRAEMEADARLSEALASLEPAVVRTPAWAQVKAAHALPQPRKRPLWLAPAFGSVALAAAVLWFVLGGMGRGAAPTAVAADNLDRSARETHMMLAVSDLSGDPNRAVTVLYGDREAW